MSDTYSGIKEFVLDRDAAVKKSIGYIESSPDDAARALELEQSTGVSAPAIAGDLPEFERQTKSRMAGDIVRNNNYIADYINSHPMAAQLSSDDYGNMDAASEALTPLEGPGSLKKIVDAFNHGTGEGPVGTWAFDSKVDYSNPINRLGWAAWSLLGAPVEVPFRLFSGLLYGAAATVGESYKAAGGSEAWANRLTRDVIQATEANLTGNMLFRGPIAHEFQQAAKQAERAVKVAQPYVKAGHEPPVGLDPLWDDAKIKQSEMDVDALMDSIKESQSSLTKDRNPDMYAGFLKQQVGEQSIGIRADAVRALYGDKPSAWDDAMLGFVPRLDDKLITAEATGGYVDVPMAEYIAKVDPQVAKTLEEFTRVRQGGLSKGEAQVIKAAEKIEALPPERAVETVRDAGALVGKERKLELKRLAEPAPADWTSVPGGAATGGGHAFEIVGEQGKVADLFVGEENGGKRLYIDDIRSLGSNANVVGPRALRDLLQQLKAEFPNAEELTGFRVSGARDKAGSWEKTGKVSIKLAEPTASDHLFQILLDDRIERLGEQTDQGEGFTATTIPEARWQNFERTIVDKVDAELEKLGINDIDVNATHKIENSKGELIRGLYQSYENARPTILFALTADDPVGVLRHEVMHDLRTRGFLNEQEWGVLEKAAIDEGWLEKHQTKSRYGDLVDNNETLIEEAIADQFADWRRNGKPAEGIYAKIFQKIDQLIEAIRSAMRELFGTENWKDIFDKIESGEVAGREPGNEFGGVTKEAKGKEPPVPEGYVRFYHGAKGSDPTQRGGKAWVTTDPVYARDFRSMGQPNDVYYVDIRKGDKMEEAARAWDEIDEQGQTNMVGRYHAIELPEEYADQFKSLNVEETKSTTKATQPELPFTRRMEDRDVFAEAQAAGMTVDQYKRYMKLIAERHREDLRLESERALKDAKRRQTEEWKKNYAETRERVVEEINERPDIATDNLLRDQRLYGRKTDPVKLGADYLSDEQKSALPKDYYEKSGAHPDDIAALTGYASGADLVQGLIGLDAKRKESGLRPIEYNRRLIAAETERQMEARFGRLADNILDEAKEQVLSETQLDLLHEEVLAAGMKAGAEFPITKDQMKSWTKERFDLLDAKDVSSDKFLADAGRAGRAAEDALLRGDPAMAFREKQRQYLAVQMTRWAKDFEKAEAAVNKLAERMRAREIKNVDQEFTNYIQGLFKEAGYPIRFSADEIAASIEFQGYASLDSFVSDKRGYGYELAVDEGYAAKPITEMTTQEFMQFKDAVETLYHAGRDAKKVNVAGDKMDYAIWRQTAIDNLEKRPPRSMKEREAGGKWLYNIDAPLTRIEELMKDFDFREEAGPFFQAIIVPFAQSKAKAFDMLTDLSKSIRELPHLRDKKWRRELDTEITQSFIIDPDTGVPFEMTRWNMLKMMMNMGTESNFNALARGIATARLEVGKLATKEDVAAGRVMIEDLVHRNATAKDWEFVQRIFDMFKEWKPQADTIYRNLSGVAPKWVADRVIETPHGQFAGGYFPLIPDKNRMIGKGIRENDGVVGNGPLGADFFRATVHNAFYKERTGATYWVDITNGMEQLAGRMQQVVHDIAYRDFVVNSGKILYDPVVKSAIKKYYGPEYEAQLVPWLKRVANEFTGNEKELGAFNSTLRQVRLNLIAAALPLNYTVMLSPSLGTANLKTLYSFNADRAVNKKMVMENSRELQHMLYNLDRDVSAAINDVVGKGKYTEYQMKAVETMFKPLTWLEQQMRMNTFYGEFMGQKAKGKTDFEAATLADSLIRERHGASAVGDLPALMANKNEIVRTATVFMGYFTTVRNWARQLPHEAREGNVSNSFKILWGTLGIATLYNVALFTKSKENETWAHYLSRAVLSTPLSMIPFMREAWTYASEGYQPTSPIFSLFKTIGDIGKDGYNALQGKRVKDPVKHVFSGAGQIAGLPGAVQMGRTADFANDVRRGEQRPRNIFEWARGVITGEARLKK